MNRFALVLLFSVLLQQSRAFFFSNARRTLSPASVKNKPEAELAQLRQLIEESQNGIDKSLDKDVRSLMTEISYKRVGDQREKLPGEWELIYTTEKEVNFFKTSWPFAKVSSITQKLDLYNTKTVDNSINFDGGAAFAVTGEVDAVSSNESSEFDRVQFTFTDAAAKNLWGKTIRLPPTGAGWFDTMYCDDTYRLSQDSRGDWSVFRRM